jgi:hypothetical protein
METLELSRRMGARPDAKVRSSILFMSITPWERAVRIG